MHRNRLVCCCCFFSSNRRHKALHIYIVYFYHQLQISHCYYFTSRACSSFFLLFKQPCNCYSIRDGKLGLWGVILQNGMWIQNYLPLLPLTFSQLSIHMPCHEQMKSIFLIDNHGLNMLKRESGGMSGETRWRVIEMKFKKVFPSS